MITSYFVSLNILSNFSLFYLRGPTGLTKAKPMVIFLMVIIDTMSSFLSVLVS